MQQNSMLFARDGEYEADVALISDNYRGVATVAAQSDICARDDSTRQIRLLLEGWACKYRLMGDGRRQILCIHLPGEVVDLEKVGDHAASFGVLALTECRVAAVSTDWLAQASEQRSSMRNLLLALMRAENVAKAEQIVSLGRRSARERTAYLMCDLLARLQVLGLARDGCFRLPLTQVDMGDHLGLSTVHVNRTLQDLRSERLIESSGRSYKVCNRDRLERLAHFQASSIARPSLIASPLAIRAIS